MRIERKVKKVVNVNKLKGKIIERNMSVEKLANSMGLNKSTIYRKLSNDGENLTVKEIDTVIETLKLSSTEVLSIFFTQVFALYANKRER